MNDPGQNTEPPAKRKKEKAREKTQPCCVVHFVGISHGTFKFFNDDKTALKVKIDKIPDIKERRLAEAVTSSYRMQEQCNLIPGDIATHHGYHWNCYKRFIGNLDRLGQSSSTSTESTPGQRPTRRTSTEKDHILFKPDCIFCESEGKKATKVKGSWTTQGVSQFTSDAWKSVPEMAEKKKDEKL